MNFSALLATASYSGIYNYNLSVQLANLQMINATGVNIVRIDMDFDPWLKNDTAQINQMDAIVNAIKADGKQVCIADGSAESYRKSPLSWQQFEAAFVARVKTIAALYHPYCYIVVKEPGWYYPMISPLSLQKYSAGPWVNLTESLISAVKNVSPNTKIGVAVPGSTIYHGNNDNFALDYMTAATKINGLSFLGFDDYGQQDLADTMRFVNQTNLDGK